MSKLTDSEKAIFQVVISLNDPSERQDFLRQACGSNALLLQQLQKLIAADEASAGFLNPPAELQNIVNDDNLLDVPSKQIGKYKLLQKIGEGGFGVVYMAEQQEPLALKVALKVIKLGMDTKQVVTRFEAERQALAMMDHPYIAKVLDGGATETGRPFFVMELVRGVSIMKYCDQEQLTNQQRLSIFIDICGGIQHAHQKGIVHRDLKPNNILITLHDGRPVPKIIDFGIAKAMQGRLTEKTLFTRFEQFIGTPAYMSPEHAGMNGLDIDTRSDIYSLGVLLYELLTGQIPFDSGECSNVGYDIIRRRIREQSPPMPSTLLSSLKQDVLFTVAKNRRGDPNNLSSLLRSDLDWIVMKAMEKDRTRRYETAGAFAEDIDRYLRQVPVRAVPPSKMYRFQKFARRNQTAISVAAAFAVILVLATTISLMQAVRAVKAEQEQGRLLVVAEEALIGEKLQSQAAQEAAELAEAGRLRARQIAYASDMLAADQALKENNLRRAQILLDRNRPTLGEADLRNWEWRALWQRCQSNAISTFSASEYQVCSISVSPDGKWLATGQIGGEIRIWNLQLGKTESILSSLSSQIPSESLRSQVVFAPEGDRLFTTAGNGTVKVWDTNSWTETELQFSHGAPIASIRLSPDGTLLVIFGLDKTISLWNTTKQTEQGRIDSGDSRPSVKRAVAISAGNQWLAIGLFGGSIRMVDLATLEEHFRFPALVEGERVETLAFSPDGKILASGTGLSDTAVNLWSVSDRKMINRLEGHTRYVHSLIFSPNGKQLASASADQTIRVWDTETWTDPTVLRGHKQEVWALAFTSDSAQLASGSKGGEICLWNPSRPAEVSWPVSLHNELLHHVRGVSMQGRASFSPDGQWLATQNKGGMVSLRTAKSLSETHTLTELGNNNTGVLFAPQGRLLVVGDDAGMLTWVDPLHLREKKQQRLSPAAKIFPVNFSSNGKRLLVLSLDGNKLRCILCSLEEDEEPQSWALPPTVACAALSPDGRLVVTGHWGGTIRFWQVADPRKPIVIRHRRFVSGIAFSPDGSLLATGTWFGEVRIWDVTSLTPVANMHRHLTGIHAVQFSPDGKRLATAGSAGESVKLWDLATQQEVVTLNAPGISFGKIEYSPDGNAILVASFHDSLFMWRVPSWAEIREKED